MESWSGHPPGQYRMLSYLTYSRLHPEAVLSILPGLL